MEKTKKVLKIVGNVFIWVFVAFAVLVTILVFASNSDADGVPAISGKCFINIISDSMEPTINEGDVIIGRKLLPEEKTTLKLDDIITFRTDLDGDGNEEFNSHRIVGINYAADGVTPVSYDTKGDNPVTNPVKDRDPVSCQKVIAIYTETRIPLLGSFLSFLQTSLGFFLVILLPLVALFIYQLIKFIIAFSAVRGKTAKLSADEEAEIKQRAIEEYIRLQNETKAAEEAKKAEPEIKTEPETADEAKVEAATETAEEAKVEAVAETTDETEDKKDSE